MMKRVVLEGDELFSFLHMTGSLLEKAKSMGSNFFDTVGCPFPLQRRIISLRKLCPIASQEAISTVSESTVGEVIHLRIFADDSPINQALKRGDSVTQWKRNLECLLQCFFALSLRVSVTLSL
ncbi:unnamed protein product [Prunus armeniaca]|uniref:Uncharacterized protein n=1 Tax=Prunus armeniaca TaxID=36596 RepID=A0A6J5TLX5_PRUAR|nr:unnamed protein product [Prunus armeniaca]